MFKDFFHALFNKVIDAEANIKIKATDDKIVYIDVKDKKVDISIHPLQ